MNDTLKPCPSCGGKATRYRSWTGRLSLMIGCGDPECLGFHYEYGEQGGWGHEGQSLNNAVAKWNTRVEPTPSRKEQ